MAWADDAFCKGMTVDTFYPSPDATDGERERVEEAAKKICRLCPSREACLDWALRWPETTGVWGGHTETERRTLQRRLLGTRRRGTTTLQPCGTTAAYRRHLRRGDVIDDACAEANRVASANRKAARKEAA